LVELRNPWGKGEWTGAYSDNSPEWTQELKQKLSIHEDDDGTFYMTFEDFIERYDEAAVCKVHDDYQYTSLRIDSQEED